MYFRGFSRGSPVSPISFHERSSLLNPTVLIFSYSHSFIYSFIQSVNSWHLSPRLWLRKIFVLAHQRCIINAGWCGGGRNVERTMRSSVRLWASVNIALKKMGRERLITILRPKIQLSILEYCWWWRTC